MTDGAGPALFDVPAVPGRFVNPRCVVHERDGLRVAMVDGSPFHTWPVGDTFAENVFVVQARQAQVATIEELAVATGRPKRTLFRVWSTFETNGLRALVPKRRGPAPKTSRDLLVDAAVRRLHAGGAWSRAIATSLGCSPTTVNRALARMGLEPNRVRQRRLFTVEPSTSETPPASDTSPPSEPPRPPAPASDVGPSGGAVEEEPTPWTLDQNPLNRCVDRLLASRGELDDAAPLFASGEHLPHVGVLLAIPSLVETGLLPEARRLYGNIGPAFYGLRTSLVSIVLLSLLRLKRPEHLKEFAPPDLGRVLGLDRAPEVKTMRRKLHHLADGPYEALLLALAKRRAATREEALGWLYVDGHVRAYSGKERIPMAHIARMRISMPATQDMWVHDGDGRPVLCVTQEAHPSLANALRPVLDDAREIVGDRRVTMVFDRGGWSPDLFADLVEADVDVLTYRKGKFDPVDTEAFASYPGRPGEPPWLLHDQSVRIRRGLWMRQITRLVGAHQTAIVTTRQDLPPEVLARRMFDRWRQENFFKYMRQEFDLDGLCEYGAEDDDPCRETPNPEWTRLDKALRKAKQAHQAAAVRKADDPAAVADAAARVDELKRQRDAHPRRVIVGDLEKPTVRLPARTKSLYDGLKTLAWQIETDLVNATGPFFRRSDDEGRTLVGAALRSSGSLDVRGDELVVTLAAQSSPHRSRAIAGLCALLDATETRFPGTRLRLRYRVARVDPPAPSKGA
jgi:hypothetical protein